MATDLIERLRAARGEPVSRFLASELKIMCDEALVEIESLLNLLDLAHADELKLRAELERLQSLLEVSRANEEELRKALRQTGAAHGMPDCDFCGHPSVVRKPLLVQMRDERLTVFIYGCNEHRTDAESARPSHER